MWWFRWRWRGWSSIITEYLVDVEELCNRSPAVNYFQLVKVLVLVVRPSEIITFCPATERPVLITQLHLTPTPTITSTARELGRFIEKLYDSISSITFSPSLSKQASALLP